MASSSVSKRPIWLVEAAPRSTARPPTIQRIAGSRHKRSASFTSSVTAKVIKDGLPALPRHAVPSVLAGEAIREIIANHVGRSKGVIKFPIGKQTGIRGHLGAMKLQLHAEVKIDPKPPRFDSPIGYAMITSLSVLQLSDSYSRIILKPH